LKSLFQIETTNSFLLSEILTLIKSEPGEGEISSSPFSLGKNEFVIEVEYEDTFNAQDSHISSIGIRYVNGTYPSDVFQKLLSKHFPNHVAHQIPTYIVNIDQDRYRLESDLNSFMRFAERPHLYQRNASINSPDVKIPIDTLRFTMEKQAWRGMDSVAIEMANQLEIDIKELEIEQADNFTQTPTREIEVGNERYIYFATMYKSSRANYKTYLVKVMGIFIDSGWQGTLYEDFIKIDLSENFNDSHKREIIQGITEKLDNVHDDGTIAKLAWREHPKDTWFDKAIALLSDEYFLKNYMMIGQGANIKAEKRNDGGGDYVFVSIPYETGSEDRFITERMEVKLSELTAEINDRLGAGLSYDSDYYNIDIAVYPPLDILKVAWKEETYDHFEVDTYGNKKYYNSENQLHRDGDLPAIEAGGGSKSWYQNGKMHRDNGPAYISANGHKEWYVNGEMHRDGGPAWIDSAGQTQWIQHGKRHRIEGPAVEWEDGSVEWYQRGKRHRENGPSVTYATNRKPAYYLFGHRFKNKEEYIEALNNLKNIDLSNIANLKLAWKRLDNELSDEVPPKPGDIVEDWGGNKHEVLAISENLDDLMVYDDPGTADMLKDDPPGTLFVAVKDSNPGDGVSTWVSSWNQHGLTYPTTNESGNYSLDANASENDIVAKPEGLKNKLKEVSLCKDENGYYVKTHRARSDSYETPEKIPDKDIDFISSTGSIEGLSWRQITENPYRFYEKIIDAGNKAVWSNEDKEFSVLESTPLDSGEEGLMLMLVVYITHHQIPVYAVWSEDLSEGHTPEVPDFPMTWHYEKAKKIYDTWKDEYISDGRIEYNQQVDDQGTGSFYYDHNAPSKFDNDLASRFEIDPPYEGFNIQNRGISDH